MRKAEGALSTDESLTIRLGRVREAFWEKVGFEGSTGVYWMDGGLGH